MAVDINITPIIREVTILVGTNAGAAVWGGITGTLSNQTDLAIQQTAQDDAIALNTAKDGITAQQASDITTNNAKISYTDSAAVALNTAKVTFPEAPNDGTQYARKDLGWETIVGGSSPILTAVKTADETKVSDTTLALDSELFIALEANTYYMIKLNWKYASGGTPDFKWQLETPLNSTGSWSIDGDSLTEGTFAFTTVDVQNGFGSSILTSIVNVFIKTVDAGTFGFKWAQNISDVSSTTIKEDSNIIATKLN